jgi:hypothetical protein
MPFASYPTSPMQTLLPFVLLLAVACSAPSPTPTPVASTVDARPTHAPVFDKPVSMAEAKANGPRFGDWLMARYAFQPSKPAAPDGTPEIQPLHGRRPPN